MHLNYKGQLFWSQKIEQIIEAKLFNKTYEYFIVHYLDVAGNLM